jgi:hypothetical protein
MMNELSMVIGFGSDGSTSRRQSLHHGDGLETRLCAILARGGIWYYDDRIAGEGFDTGAVEGPDCRRKQTSSSRRSSTASVGLIAAYESDPLTVVKSVLNEPPGALSTFSDAFLFRRRRN